jgi:hypothetical protein
LKWENCPGSFSPRRPSVAASRPKSRARGWPITVHAPQSSPPEAHLSGSFSPIPTAGAILAKPRCERPAKAAPSHPLSAGHRLKIEPSPHIAARRCAAVACRNTPLLRSLMAPVRVCHLGCRLAPPPFVLCSSATCTCLRTLFATWRMPFRRMMPRRSLPLQRGADSRLAPKCAASCRVMAAAVTATAVPKPPRCAAHTCRPPLCHALR